MKSESSKSKRRTVRCPKCSSTKTVPIWYGGIFPDELMDPYMCKKIESGDFHNEGLDFDDKGEVIHNPAIRHCNVCSHNY